MVNWLRALQIPGYVCDELIREEQCCECGRPAVAIGTFVIGAVRMQQAMWLCDLHAGLVDEGVSVHEIPEEFSMDREALFYALVRAELKRLMNRCGPPDRQRWDRERLKHLPEARMVEQRTGRKWEEMVHEVTFVR